jgi:hypothetical protein
VAQKTYEYGNERFLIEVDPVPGNANGSPAFAALIKRVGSRELTPVVCDAGDPREIEFWHISEEAAFSRATEWLDAKLNDIGRRVEDADVDGWPVLGRLVLERPRG